ncbi:hypothetical protein K493DRAFT_321386 [Basidiobolus meristosporus CBS 931.73]|uniref:Uncharacterized protein n=1 Tax=Basidiobolus meristosporus CBS 931.73 TaxID=1314790 RepID=A0A1Y1WV16_9FUNG|nr:hypothetical protein K493DRAFT_321386 [Basidiobolus meristosporus CBS 931.73]|eukprot:ORX77397.1 hypothetical protein K493DRAFT_321386 [Basidiobolus meristosporus CBS 931.73]
MDVIIGWSEMPIINRISASFLASALASAWWVAFASEIQASLRQSQFLMRDAAVPPQPSYRCLRRNPSLTHPSL